jgi:predicted RNA binding protein YcfA (HicA-like mRNA interferase family)
MGKLPGISHLQAIKAFERAGFTVIRQSGHVIMSDGINTLVIPRANPVNAFTMFGIVKDARLTIEQFRKLL